MLRAALVAIAGACLLTGIVGWRLRASYARDLATVCEAESRSGLAMGRDMAGVTDWTQAHLETRDGNAFYSSLSTLPVGDRAARLTAEASARGVLSCPLATTYEALVDDARLRADVQRLCSRVTFPDLASVQADERAGMLEGWLDTDAAGPRAQALGPGLRAAATHADRARLLDAVAHGVDVLTCDNAKDLLLPDPTDAAAP